MIENSFEFGGAVEVDYQLAGALLAGLDFDRGAELFAELIFQSTHVWIDHRRRLRFGLILLR